MTLITYDEKLCSTKSRFEVPKTMRDNDIPKVVWLCLILPFINDTEDNISEMLDMCKEAKV